MDSSESDISNADLSLNIFTLNCWGLAYISKNRDKRMKAIARHLNEQNYDIVFLQEIWLESDFNYIKSVVKTNFKFSYFYKNSSFFGNPGLALFSKYQPTNLHFEKFATNGNPFKLWHGDWFTGKGVGYALIPINGYNFHLFNTHFHAQYNDNEALDSQYSIHRICQSYQLAKFINLNTNFTKNQNYNGRDVVILAGDLNTPPEELPYKLLLSMTGLHDSCHIYQKQKIVEYGNHKEEDFITCGHPFNTYTAEKTGYVKRIDYILFKLLTGTCKIKLANLAGDHLLNDNHPYIIDRIECKTKCDISGLSFSDHQPVAIKLGLKHTEIPLSQNIQKDDILLSSGDDILSEETIEQLDSKTVVTSINCSSNVSIETIENNGDDYKSHNVITFNGEEDEIKLPINNTKNNKFKNGGQSIKNRKSSGNFYNLNEEDNLKEDNCNRKDSTSIFLLRSKCFGDNKDEILKDIKKLESNDYAQIYRNQFFYLKTCQKLFKRYLDRTNTKLWLLTILLIFIFIIFTFVLIVVNLVTVEFPFEEFINRNNITIVCAFLNTLTIIAFIILQITYRLEVNSIFWILRESDVLLLNDHDQIINT